MNLIFMRMERAMEKFLYLFLFKKEHNTLFEIIVGAVVGAYVGAAPSLHWSHVVDNSSRN